MTALRRLAIVATLLGFVVLGAQIALSDTVLTDQPQLVVKSAPAPKEDAADQDAELRELRDDVQILCGGSNARVQMDGTGASLPSYPCSVAQTNMALYRLQNKEGFVPGAQRFYLRASSFTRGIGATILGWVGLS